VFLLLLNLALLITGCLMDIYSAILVVAPLIIPLGALYEVHPVQLGIIFLANLQLGYLTPPVGMNLFLASYTFGEPMNRIYRQILPFLAVLLVAVLFITYVPWFSLVLLG
jgi:TRAP-type C4-dicarboxylate transport system permease large subunit